jgi:regulator of protease activity HflC (stomatin/prohibitin superfamily)
MRYNRESSKSLKEINMNVTLIIRALVTVLWLFVVAFIGYVIYRKASEKSLKGASALVAGLVVVTLAVTALGAGLYFLQADERGVVVSAFAPRGYREQPLDPGLRWVIPFAETVKTYSISRQTYTMSATPNEGQVKGDDSITVRTTDGQLVKLDASVIFAIDPQKIIPLHIQWQDRYVTSVVRPISQGVIRDNASQYTVEEIISSKRAELEKKITESLAKVLESNNLILIQFVLRDLQFSPEFSAAVEQKVVAQQNALQSGFMVSQKEQEAEQARQVARGQADSAVIIAQGDAIVMKLKFDAQAKAWATIAEILKNNPELLTYEYIQKIAPNLQVIYLPSGQPLILPSNLVPPQ